MIAKLYAISDNPNARTGLALASVPSQPAHTPEEVQMALENMPPDAGIVIITSNLASKSTEILEKYRNKHPQILITVIP